MSTLVRTLPLATDEPEDISVTTPTVHGVWANGALYVWMEIPHQGKTTARPFPEGPTRARKHPGVAAAAEIERMVRLKSEGVTISLELPSSNGLPLPSKAPWQQRWLAPRDTVMRPWRVSAIRVPSPVAVRWLNQIDPSVSPDEFRFGTSLVYLTKVFAFARELSGRGRFVPTLTAGRHYSNARWRALVFGADVPRLESLCSAMPTALQYQPAVSPGERPRRIARPELLRELLDHAIDDHVRSHARAPKRRGRQQQTPTRAFVGALCSPDGTLDIEFDIAADMSTRLRQWAATAADLGVSVRPCFRLEPPIEDDSLDEDPADEWRLYFQLQSLDDPSLIVDAREIWEAGATMDAFGPDVVHPQEHLLAGLGNASRLYPPIADALEAPAPEFLALETNDAARFLQEHASMLEQAGYGVLLPSWWGTRRAKLGVRLDATTPAFKSSASVVGEDALCDYRMEVALDDETISLDELEEIARLKQPLVRIRGKWVELNDRDLQAALTVARTKRKKKRKAMTAVELLATAMGTKPLEGIDLPVVDLQASGWLGDMLNGANTKVGSAPRLDGFEAQLRPYQERGLSWLWFFDKLGMGACLADDMGLGKTAQLLALLVAERTKQKRRAGVPDMTGAPTLVVCPMSLVGNWQREAARFAPGLNVYVHHGSGRARHQSFITAATNADLVLTTYALAVRDRKALQNVGWHRIVLDEAQNIKNSETLQAQAVRSLPAQRRIALTGTPVENRLRELWSIFDFLNPGLLGTETGFEDRFATPIEQEGDAEARTLLRRVTAPFILRRLKTDKSIITDLPDKVEMKTYCNLTREQATLYKAVVNDMMQRIQEASGIERKGLVLATMSKLKQVCNHPAQFLHDGSRIAGRSGKLAVLDEIINEIRSEREKVLVFTQYTEMGTMLRRHIEAHFGEEVLWLHGGSSRRQRDAMVEQFQSPSTEPGIFLVSLLAGGTGLNLTAASHVIHFDRWWNPAVENQATDRAFRIGQKQNVQVRKFICVGTLEERIDAIIESKRSLAENVIGDGDSWITELSTSAIRDLIKLSAEAVSD
jgi:SNF2 family DNA or RNA helicase